MSAKIAIGYIHGGTVDQPFVESLHRFLTFDSMSRRLTLGVGHVKGPYLDDNRNELTRDFLTIPNADYFLSLDTDIEFEPHGVYDLLDDMVKHDRAIESGMYFGVLTQLLRPVWFIDGATEGSVKTIGQFSIGHVLPLAACGMGCCLIRRDVFEKIYAVPEYANDGWPWFCRESIIVDGKPAHEGEDIGFCLRAKKVGFQTWGNTNVQARHWKKYPLDLNMFRLYYDDAVRQGKNYV